MFMAQKPQSAKPAAAAQTKSPNLKCWVKP